MSQSLSLLSDLLSDLLIDVELIDLFGDRGSQSVSNILLETGDNILLEDGDFMLVE